MFNWNYPLYNWASTLEDIERVAIFHLYGGKRYSKFHPSKLPNDNERVFPIPSPFLSLTRSWRNKQKFYDLVNRMSTSHKKEGVIG